MGKRNRWRSACANSDPQSLNALQQALAEWKALKNAPPAARAAWLRKYGIAAHGAQTTNQLLKEIDRQHKRIAKAVCSPCWIDAFDNEGISPPLPAINPIKLMRCPLREKRKMSLEELAAWVGVPSEIMREWEASVSRPTREQVDLICVALVKKDRAESFESVNERRRQAADGLWKRLGQMLLERRFGNRWRLSFCEQRTGGPEVQNSSDKEPRWERRFVPSQCRAIEDRLDDLSEFQAWFHDYPASPSARAIQRIEQTRGREVGGARVNLRVLGQ